MATKTTTMTAVQRGLASILLVGRPQAATAKPIPIDRKAYPTPLARDWSTLESALKKKAASDSVSRYLSNAHSPGPLDIDLWRMIQSLPPDVPAPGSRYTPLSYQWYSKMVSVLGA